MPQEQGPVRREPEPRLPDGPLFVSSSPHIPPAYDQAGWAEVQRVLALTGRPRKIAHFGNRAADMSKLQYAKFAPTQWYVDEARKRQPNRVPAGSGPQINVEELFNLYTEEWNKVDKTVQYLRMMMIRDDIGGNVVKWGFGLTDAELGLMVVSARRFIDAPYSPETNLQMWRRIVRHEAGHLFGLVRRDFNVVENLGRHCTNVCCMRQGLNLKEWHDLTAEEEAKGVIFCDECVHEMQAIQAKLVRKRN